MNNTVKAAAAGPTRRATNECQQPSATAIEATAISSAARNRSRTTRPTNASSASNSGPTTP